MRRFSFPSSANTTSLCALSSHNTTMNSLLLLLLATLPSHTFVEGFTATSLQGINRSSSHFSRATTILHTASLTADEQQVLEPTEQEQVNIVLVTGFESFNRDLYKEAGRLLPKEFHVNLKGESGFSSKLLDL